MDVGFLEFMRELDGLQIIGVFFIILVMSITTLKYKSIIRFLKKKKIELDEVKEYKLKIKLVLKTMRRCKDLIIAATPDGENSELPAFNRKQKWIWDLILTNAFMGPCRDYASGLAIEKDWVKMSPAQFAEICQNEPKWVMDSVTQACIELWREDAFPVSFKELSAHNYKLVGAKCGEYIIEHWTELRNL